MDPRAILEAVPHPAMLVDAGGEALAFNALWQTSFGLTSSEAQRAGWFAAVDPREREAVQRAWEGAVSRGQSLSLPVRMRHPAGEHRWQLMRALPVAGAQGRAQGWVATFSDVTEVTPPAELAALRQAVEVRDEVLAGVSHDLRTPLSSAAMAATFIQRQASDDKVRQHAGAILRAAQRMERLVRDLLDLASTDAQRLTLDTESVSTRALLQEVIDATAALARDRGVRLRITAGETEVRCDRVRIHRVLSNLVVNAIRYSPRGAAVSLVARRTGDMMRISVVDQGPGVELAQQERIFERFWRRGDETQKGTGLGLYICRQLVEAHGGRIWVDSRPGHGSAFRFTLPLAD
ncbi:MAG: PAS domain-containing sensor histidine kinase [Myxococcota bacterium]